jgi:hypothetical protein
MRQDVESGFEPGARGRARMLYWLRDEGELGDLFGALGRERIVYAPECGADGQVHLTRAERWDAARHTLGPYRPVEPLKAVFFRPREDLGRLDTESAEETLLPRVVVGVKNCDLSGLRLHDRVMGDAEPSDPDYTDARRKTFLVSSDCSDCLEVCFCTALGEQPHPEAGFDLNVSSTSRGYVVETGSDQGEAAFRAAIQQPEPAPAEVLEERDRQRAEMRERVAAQAAGRGLGPEQDLQQAIQNSFGRPLWEDFAADCVECGACNFVCCTCHCFLLADGFCEESCPSRVKQWDSCLFENFARVAGGANPRARRSERLRNRFDKKFNFAPEVLGFYACDGCGRCTEACIGKIDIREVLKRAVDDA